MLRSLVIDNFRAFEHFELERLGRINLLVGTNNCGKTSVLEAIYLLMAGEPHALRTLAALRGEWARNELDVRHLFHGRRLGLGERFTIKGEGSDALTAEIVRRPRGRRQIALPLEGAEDGHVDAEDEVPNAVALSLKWNGVSSFLHTLPLSHDGGVWTQYLQILSTGGSENTDTARVELLSTRALDDDQAVRLLDEIILTPEEATLIEALKSIEPTIDRIASAAHGKRSRIFVKCAGIDDRIPIGSMGDGIWHLLGIALHLVATRGGVLLIDEIDTGLHYSVMETMWKLVRKTAERLDIQVFATTHSRDCYEALAAISRADAGDSSEVSIQRIEKGKPRAVAFTEPEIVIAARRGIEVR